MEFEDKNLKAAIQKAAKALNVSVDALQYEVISYGSTGIFGLVGVKKAKIKVSPPKNDNQENKEKQQKKDYPKRERKKEPPIAKPPVEKTEILDEPSEEDKEIDSIDIDPQAVEHARILIQKIVDYITDEALVTVTEKEGSVVFQVEGGKTAVLIGKRGQTLEAIQYLVDRIVNKKSDNRLRLQIDIAGYLDNRKTNLEQRALNLAEKAKLNGKPVTVGEMNIYDRKIVHMCLKEDLDVKTQSIGSGFYRKLIIFPKKVTPKKAKA